MNIHNKDTAHNKINELRKSFNACRELFLKRVENRESHEYCNDIAMSLKTKSLVMNTGK